MLLLAFYSAAVLLLDLLSLQLRLLISFLLPIFRSLRPTRMKSLAGENAVITGAGHGIGRDLALQLAEQGVRLALWDIDAARCEQIAREVRARGGRATSYCCDVSERAQVLDTANRVKRELGTVGLVINNAGIVPIHPLLAHNPQQIRRVFDVNILSHFWVLEAFLPSMIASNHGHVAAVCSMTGLVGSANLVPYSASKFAVRGLMQSLAEELREDTRRPQIHLTTIYPFIVDTGQVQRPRLRFPRLLGVQRSSHAASQIIRAIRRNQREASVPSWLLPLHNMARAFPADTFALLKNFLDSGAEAHDPAWHGEGDPAAPPCKTTQSRNGFGAALAHRHLTATSELGK